MAIAPERLRSRSDQLEFLDGPLVRQLMPLAERGRIIAPTRGEIEAGLSADCGTYYMGCPNATHAQDCYTAVEGSAPSCCLCNTNEGNCETEANCPGTPRPPDTTGAGCPSADGTCYDSSDGSCQAPDSSDGSCYSSDSSDGTCYDTASGC